jgi:DNA polymerase-3 subunit delta
MSTYENILREMKNGNFKPLYFLHGEEPFFIDQIVRLAEQLVLEEAEKSFNQHVFYGQDSESSQIIESARQFPLMSERKLVIVKEAQGLKDIENLVEYVMNPVPSTVLVIAYKYKSYDKRKKLLKSLGQDASVLESKTIFSSKIPEWIRGYLLTLGREITPKAAHLLNEYLGSDLSRISAAIDKIMLTLEENETIEDEHVSLHIGIEKEFTIFELQKTIAQRNLAKSINIVQHLARQPRNHPFPLTVGTLTRFFSNLMLLYFEPHASQSEISKKIHVPVFFLKDYFEAKKNFSAGEVVRNLDILLDYDLKSKGHGATSIGENDLHKELTTRLVIK